MVHRILDCIHTSTQRCAVCKFLHFGTHSGHTVNTLHSKPKTRNAGTYANSHSRAWHVLHTLHSKSWVIPNVCKRAQYGHVCISAVVCIPGRLHVGPLYPLGHWQVSLATQTPLTHGGSHTTEEETREHINIRTWATNICTLDACYIHNHTYIHTYIHAYIHTYTSMYTCTHVRTYTPACIF